MFCKHRIKSKKQIPIKFNEVAPGDWLRDAIVAYDMLTATADSVSIVGHSTGGTIAMYVASHRPVKHLVLSRPNIFPSATDKKYKAIAQTPILSDFVRWIPFQRFSFTNSAHNVLQDYDRDDVEKKILEVLVQ